MQSNTTTWRRPQVNIKQLMLVTLLVAIAINFPEFSLAVPFALGLSLLILFILVVIWGIAFLVEGQPGIFRQAAAKNIITVIVVILALAAYGAYGCFSLDWTMG